MGMVLMSGVWTTAHTFHAYIQLYFSCGKQTTSYASTMIYSVTELSNDILPSLMYLNCVQVQSSSCT